MNNESQPNKTALKTAIVAYLIWVAILSGMVLTSSEKPPVRQSESDDSASP